MPRTMLFESTVNRLPGVVLALIATTSPALHAADAASPRSGPLFDELAHMDQQLFDAAFVRCDEARFGALFTEDAEFYHDLAGASFGDDVRKLKGCPAERGVRRVLVVESLEVYPLKDYGAIQKGEHWFVEAGAATSTVAKFVHLWKRVDGEWRLARVLSFDHQSRPREQGPQ